MKEFILLSVLLCFLAACTPQATDTEPAQPPEPSVQQSASAKKLTDADECMGEPLTDMMCNQQYQPVCGCNQQTYSNACMAKIAGVQRWTDGRCGGPHPNE